MAINPKTDGMRLSTNAAYPRDSLVTVPFHSALRTLQSIGLISFTQSATAPASPALNDLWYKPDTGLAAATTPAGDSACYRWDGSQWKPMSPSEFATYIITLGGSFLPANVAGYLYNDGNGVLSWEEIVGGGGGGGLADGDYGDISVTGGGTTMSLDANVVNNGKLTDMAAYSFKMRNNSALGDPQDVNPVNLTAVTPAGERIVMTFDPATGQPGRSTVAQLPIVQTGKGLVALVSYNSIGTFTPVFGCSLHSQDGAGKRYTLTNPLTQNCVVVPTMTGLDGAGFLNWLTVSEQSMTHFKVNALTGGEHEHSGMFMVFG